MENKVDKVFRGLKQKREGGLIAYLCGGDPNPRFSAEIAGAVERHADLIELGIPFSDPIADGPTIQKASERALRAGTEPLQVMEIASTLRKPVLLMTYYNPVFKQGIAKFCRNAEHHKVAGLIVPDLPPDEKDAATLAQECESNGLATVFLLALTSTKERMCLAVERSTGFVYLVSVLGTTGARKEFSSQTKTLVSRVRAATKTRKPLALGFGISSPEHVKQALACRADAAVVGSALIQKIESNLQNKEVVLSEVEEFCKNLKKTTRRQNN